MGTDIYFYVERRGPDGWQRAEEMVLPYDNRNRCRHCGESIWFDPRLDRLTHEKTNNDSCEDGTDRVAVRRDSLVRATWYSRRDSDLFRVLGDLADDGLPGDVSDDVRREAGAYDCAHATTEWLAPFGFRYVKADPPCGCLFGGGHAHATARKLLVHDWTQGLDRLHEVADRDDDAFRDGGRAAHLEQVLNAAGTAVLDSFDSAYEANVYGSPEWYAMEQLLDKGGRTDAERVPVAWAQPTWRMLNTEWFATVLRMARLAGGDLDAVRCVFWFA
jgi:hypothetical protein